MGRKCIVCSSPNRAEYEELRMVKKARLVDIVQIARNKNNETFSTAALSRHFSEHVQAYVDAEVSSSRLRERLVKEKLREQINAAINIVNTLNVLNDQLNRVKDDIDNPEKRQEARSIAQVLNNVLQTALKYKDEIKLPGESSNEEVYDRLLWSLEQADVPAEIVRRIREKWDEYGGKGQSSTTAV